MFREAKSLAAEMVPRRGMVTRAVPSDRRRSRYRLARGCCTNKSGTEREPTCKASGAGSGCFLNLKIRSNITSLFVRSRFRFEQGHFETGLRVFQRQKDTEGRALAG